MSSRSGRVPILLLLALLLVGSRAAGQECIHDNVSIRADTTWTADCDQVILNQVYIDDDATLTLEPGTRLYFEEGARLIVRGGTLQAVGAEGDSILFSRRGPTEAWTGIQFMASTQGTLRYCVLEHATYDAAYGAVDARGAQVVIDRCAIRDSFQGVFAQSVMPQISDCEISTLNYGIHVQDATEASLTSPNVVQGPAVGIRFNRCSRVGIANQTVTNCMDGYGALSLWECPDAHIGPGNVCTGNSWGLTMQSGTYLDAASAGNLPIAGNANDDGIGVRGGGAQYFDTIWRNLGEDYILVGSPSVGGSRSLTIEAGVTIRFADEMTIWVTGAFNALGTPGNEVRFTSRSVTESGDGIQFMEGATGILQHCLLENGWRGIGATSASVVIEDCTLSSNNKGCELYDCDGTFRLDGCDLSGNVTGLDLTNCSPTITRCRILDNTSYGIQLRYLCFPSFGSVTTRNEIHDNGGGLPGRDLRNGTADIAAAYVYWGTTDQAAIETMVWHEQDDPSLGSVRYCPWTNAAGDSLYCPHPLGVEDGVPGRPSALILRQNSPNPFNPTTWIRYRLPRDSWVTLELLDPAGRKVALIHEGFEKAGEREFAWRPEGIASGVYIYRLQAADQEVSRKLVLLR